MIQHNPSRRDFLRGMTAAGLTTIAGGAPRLLAAESVKHPEPTADTCILLWMAGGMAAPDTFDPKRYQPFEIGVPVEKILSTFPTIDTVVDNIKITEGLENVAKVMDRATLIRSHVVADLGNILHSRHQYHRLRAAANGRLPPHRLVDRQGPRAEQPGHPAVHQHRPTARRQRRAGRTEGIHHRRVLRD
jgi:hypothetical protein